MHHGLRRLTELPVSVRPIREINAELLSGVRGGNLRSGELRSSQNWIGPAGSTLATATFVPPPHHVVPEALGDLERFQHEEDGLPVLVRIALAHVQFETIHQFLEMNGRVGSLLTTFLLTERGVLHTPVLYLSHYFRRFRQAYYDHLQAVRDDGRGRHGFGTSSVVSSRSPTRRRPPQGGSSSCARRIGARSPRAWVAVRRTAIERSTRCSTGPSCPLRTL